MKSNCNCHKSKKDDLDPTSPKYKENITNKAHEQSPFGTDEPSTHTTYK